MTGSDIQKQIQHASLIVGQWPVWKQNILNHSSQPTNSLARTPVSHQVSESKQNEEGRQAAKAG